MNQIILVEDRKELHDLLSLNLGTYVEAEVIAKSNSEEAIELLDLLPDIALVVCRDRVGDERTAEGILGYLSQHKLKTKVIVLGTIPKDHQARAETVRDPKDWKEVVDKASNMLGNGKVDVKDDILPDHSPIPAEYFLHMSSSCCDVFLHIKKTQTKEASFIKIINAGDNFSRDKIKKYIDQGLRNLYIPRDMKQNFTNYVSDHLVDRLSNMLEEDKAETEDKTEVISHAYDVATQEIMELGFNSATIQLAESVISNIVSDFENSNDISPLLRSVTNAPTGYMYKHCYMTFVVAAQILETLGLGNNDLFRVFGHAAFFHDIKFVDSNEDYAKLTSFDELEKAQLSKSDYNIVVNHAADAAKLYANHPEAPQEAEGLIRNHHGCPDGVGFSVTNFSELSGTEKIFFISCEFAKEFLTFERKKDSKPVPITHRLRKKYFDPEISKAIVALEKAMNSGKGAEKK